MKSERIRVSKEFTFDMAHALFNYDGPCKNIHGHTYRLQVTIIGYPNQDPQNPKQGMVIDFGQLKYLVVKQIINKYDHALVLNEQVVATMGTNFSNISDKIIFVPYQPTCENLMLNIKNELAILLETEGYQLQAIRLYETPSSWAEWNLADD